MSKLTRERIVEIDKARIWHPYTEMSRYRAEIEPLVIERAEGSRLYDVDGKCYLDGNASWWTSTLGHGHPRLLEALKTQGERLAHTALAGMTHPAVAELTDKLTAVTPEGLVHLFYSDNGSTAVEVAMKLALQYWHQNGHPGRTRFLALEEAFHGDTIGTSALGGVEVFRKPFEACLLDCIHVPSPGDPAAADRAIDALRDTVRANADRLAAVVLESMVQGAAGMRVYAPEYLRAAREVCDETGVLLVLDEVFAGYGRTGPMWASEHAGIVPDMQCMAKGFSGGMFPMGVTATHAKIFEGFLGEPERAFYYGHTFCGNPLGAAVASAVLDVFEQEQILERAKGKAQRIAAAFDEMAGWSGVERTRSLGMIGALDLAGEGGYLADAGWRVYAEALQRGAYLRPLGNVVYTTPSLNIPDADLEALLEILCECVAKVAHAL